jgi:hypothetical protein
VVQTFTPRVGSRGQTSNDAVFRLQKAGDGWVIVERK